MNPFRDGLPALSTYRGPNGEDKLLFLGIEAATRGIVQGWRVSAEDMVFYDKLIQRVDGLDSAIKARVKMQGAEDG